MPTGRKKFIQQIGTGLLAAGLPVSVIANTTNKLIDPEDFESNGDPDDEKYWNRIAQKYYDIPGDYTNLENGYYGVQSKPVLEAFIRNVQLANKEGARFARKVYPGLFADIRKQLAAFLQVSTEEIIITRNATEALNIAIQGYPFKPGDEVLINQLDYFSMTETFRMMEKRGQIKVNTFEMPLLPASEETIVEEYQKAITDKTKVILLTHVSNINGLIIPVAKIAAMARQKSIDTITDSAHALGHIPFSLPGLGCDFVGMNLHKWIGNPIGAGVLYVKKERIREMSILFGDIENAEDNINKLAHFGTTPFAVNMTIPDSLAFHQLMDVQKITKRLHYLKSIWMEAIKDVPTAEIVSPKELTCAIASFRIKDKKAGDVAEYLFREHKILTVARTLGKSSCVRVTPTVYNSSEDMLKLVEAIRKYGR